MVVQTVQYCIIYIYNNKLIIIDHSTKIIIVSFRSKLPKYRRLCFKSMALYEGYFLDIDSGADLEVSRIN